MTISLVAILLALACWALTRRFRRRAESTRELEIISRAGLSQKAGLALVSVSGRRLLVGYGGESPVLLFDAGEERAHPDEEEMALAAQSSFSQLMQKSASRRGLPVKPQCEVEAPASHHAAAHTSARHGERTPPGAPASSSAQKGEPHPRGESVSRPASTI